ncbi:MAG: ABC transporter ATP-binding protein [Hyphomicrobiaceae bacterium]|nr:ABC transporter ATP-binding protein [Hyphomicrobiaceae bacterium]
MTDGRTGDSGLLAVSNLSLHFDTYEGTLKVLDEVDLAIGAGETVGIVGETGCGKSVLAKSILRLLPADTTRYPNGTIAWNGENLLAARGRRLQQVRGTEIGMVFQDPMTFLDPLYSAGSYLVEAIAHRDRVKGTNSARGARRDEAIALLRSLHLADPERVFASYPHQLSGGMRQRVLIAAAIAGHPKLLIADEPTTALDVTVQAQILRILLDLVDEQGMAMMLVSHDLGVIASVCQRIVVMYAGTVVEAGSKTRLLSRPAHPYTLGLTAAVPRLGHASARVKGIPGQIPNLLDPPTGCRFSPRCPRATAVCRSEKPRLRAVSDGQQVACHHPVSSDA